MPVARFWNTPWTTLILFLIGERTSSVFESFMSAPEPSDDQCSSFTPIPMKRTAKRFGYADGAFVSANAISDSSHGSPMATPAPRRMVRRESPFDFVRSDMLFPPLLFLRAPLRAELRTRHNRVHQRAEAIAVGAQRLLHLVDRRLNAKHERPSQRVRQQLTAEVVEEVVLTMLADV